METYRSHEASSLDCNSDKEAVQLISQLQNTEKTFITAQDELTKIEDDKQAEKKALQVETLSEEGSDADVEQMSERERRMYLLREKMRASRKANQEAIVSESRRKKVPGESTESVEKKKWFEERQKKQEERLKSLGLTSTQGYRLESAEIAEAKYKKKEKKPAPFGWDVFNQKTLYRAYEARSNKVPYTAKDYVKQKETNPELYKTGDGVLLYGQAADLPEENVEKMVNELNERELKRDQFSRRRKHYDERDIDFINDRNKKFNQKIERAFGKYTVEIKSNLERGTALPDH